MDPIEEFLFPDNGNRENPAAASGSENSAPILGSAQEIKKMVALAEELDIPPLILSHYRLDPKLVKLIPEEVARTYQIIPVAETEHELTVAMSDPFDIVAIDMVKSLSKAEIYLVISTSSEINKAIDLYYTAFDLDVMASEGKPGLSKDVKIQSVVTEQEEINVEKITKISKEAPVIRMVNAILSEAVKSRASDIHIEPYKDKVRLRYRIDGILHEREPIPPEQEHAAVARIKIMSNLDITQRRLPQDGRLSFRAANKDIDCRVSVLPIHSGEKIVMRLLEKGNLQLELDTLGFSPYALEAFKKSSLRPYGMILLTGPTGSGKSTSLYAILNQLNDLERNIITIEDPVEYQIKGITQIQVKPEIGLTFANTLRAVLRQNPNIIMIGEIRDYETVDIAMKASLTGHLILSTLHTNDAPSAIVRLFNMQVEPFLISSTLVMIAAQRLCRRICPECKEPHEISVTNLQGLSPDFKGDKGVVYRGKGCKKCDHTGYYGRIPVVEALVIDNTIRQMILDRASLIDIREYAKSTGMKTLREDAVSKALAGVISLEEALRITPEG